MLVGTDEPASEGDEIGAIDRAGAGAKISADGETKAGAET
jgi:hypothetical protein